jgi:hypothetical protein
MLSFIYNFIWKVSSNKKPSYINFLSISRKHCCFFSLLLSLGVDTLLAMVVEILFYNMSFLCMDLMFHRLKKGHRRKLDEAYFMIGG